jgi:outer membrane protein assembly factor BamD
MKADPSAEALYDEGVRAFNDKKYVRALDNFSKLRSDHPFSPLITQTEFKVAESYYFNEQYPEAINAFKEFQTLHPTNENIPLVILRLGQSHFNQFTSTDRDQKTTEVAKGYFESVIANYPKSPQAAEAQEKLAKCLEYLAEHEFNVAYFYYQQEKFPPARDRFEEIVRKYKDTPTAVKSLFFLGESYRNEKNAIRATLAYEALMQHYPQSKFAAQAKTQLAQVEKEKRDPMALLLMRDRRPGAAATPEVKEDPALAKLKDLNLVQKKEVVFEEPGAEKGFLTRVSEKLNPFSSGSSSKDEKKPDSAVELLAKRNEERKKAESEGFLASLWPFGSEDSKSSAKTGDAKSTGLVSQIDESLNQKGIDASTRQAALKPPAADLPKSDAAAQPAPKTDTTVLLSSIDSNLKKDGKNVDEMPAPPEAAAAFRDTAATQAAIAKARESRSQAPIDVQSSSGVLDSIDQKLKARGVEASKLEPPPTTEEIKAAAAQKPQTKNVELEPKLALEKGPLFLNPGETKSQEKVGEQEAKKTDGADMDSAEISKEPPNRVLVKGPVQSQSTEAARPPETKKPTSGQEEEPKGTFDQIRQDMESVSKALNPFQW